VSRASGMHAAPATPRPAASGGSDDTAATLVGQFAEDVSRLVRAEMEVTVAEHAGELQQLSLRLAAALGAVSALFLALAALSWTALAALMHVAPTWVAALVVAAVWSEASGALARWAHPRDVMALFSAQAGAAVTNSTRVRRNEAEVAVRGTAARLGVAFAHEMARSEWSAATGAEARVAAAIEHETDTVLKDVLAVVLAPGRAGVGLLERLAAGR
jgi:hypothetical protein